MIKKRYIIALFLSLISVFSFYSQTTKIDCKAILMEYMKVLESLSTPKNGQVAYLKFTTEVGQKNDKTVKSTSEVISSNQKVVVKGNNMQTYADTKNVFVVVPRVKSIYWNDSSKEIFKKSKLPGNYFNLERQLINSAESITCNSLGSTITIRIVTNAEFRKKTKIKNQKVVYDTQKKQVISVKNNFMDSAKYKYQLITYSDMDFNSKMNIREAYKYIFKGSQLLSDFKNYQIIDNRKK